MRGRRWRKSEGGNSSDIVTVQVSMVVVILQTVNILHNFHARFRDGMGYFICPESCISTKV